MALSASVSGILSHDNDSMQSRGSLRTPQDSGQGEAAPSNVRVRRGCWTWWKVRVALDLQFVSESGNYRMVAGQAPLRERSDLQGSMEH